MPRDFKLDPSPDIHGSTEIWQCLLQASAEITRSNRQVFQPDTTTGDTLPRWPSGIHKIDTTLGGFYGLTSLYGDGGLGKTKLAFASAIEAAATMDWRVVYCGVEIDEDEMSWRFERYLEANPHAEDAVEQLVVLHLGRGSAVDSRGVREPYTLRLAREIEAEVRVDRDDHLLVVLDSINTIADFSGEPYLNCLREIAIFAMLARKLSMGRVSFLIVSESNKAGKVQGAKLKFLSDLQVRMKGTPGDLFVTLDIDKIRRHQAPLLGRYVFDGHRQRYVLSADLDQPYLQEVK